MKALIVGLGSAGRRHARSLRRIDPGVEIGAWRRTTSRDGSETVDHVFPDELQALGWRPDVAVIATPAPYHVGAALALARAGVHLLVEKPLSHDLEGISELLDVCQKNAVVLLVGYNLRFDATLRAVRAALAAGAIGRLLHVRAEVGQYLPDWRPWMEYRASVTARRELGGGVLLEASHEIDYVRWLSGDVVSIAAWTGHVSDLEVDVEDTAELVLEFESGIAGSIHLDMIQRTPVRYCRLIGAEGTLIWDATARQGWLHRSGKEPQRIPVVTDADPDSYVNEMRHFLGCVRGDATPEVTGADGRRALELVLAAKCAAASGARVKV